MRIEVFPGRKDGSEFAYYTGAGVQKIEVRPGGDGVEVSVGDLGAKGELQVYCRGVQGVKRDGTVLREGSDYRYDPKSNKLTIPFQKASSLTIVGAKGLFDSAAAPAAAQ